MEMMDYILQFNMYGWATFPTQDKKPLHKGWKTIEPMPIGIDPSIYTTDQYAVRLNPDDLVIDVDPRNFVDGVNSWRQFKQDMGMEDIDKNTLVVKSGGGGYHIYLKRPANVPLLKGFPKYPGVEFRSATVGKGFYVVGPGSAGYTIYRGEIGQIDAAPSQLVLDLMKTGNVSDRQPKSLAGFSDDQQNIDRFIEFLKTKAAPAIEGKLGDTQTFKVACRGRDFRLSESKTYELMLEHYNPLCQPPWTPRQLETKVKNAYTYNIELPGKYDPALTFEREEINITSADQDKYENINQGVWDITKGGDVKKTLRNAVLYVRTHGCITNSIRFNEFSQDIEILKPLPWSHRRASGRLWIDNDTVHLKYFITKLTNVEFDTATLGEAVYIVASDNLYHPIREYLNGLKWDGARRLDDWLSRYMGSADNAYTRIAGRKTLIAAVTRAYKPGMKFDYTLVLEGEQGIGKSHACAVLGGPWFGDISIDPKNKDTVDAMRGKWIIELSEMDTVRRRQDIQSLKAFLTRTEDRVRLAYARATTDFPRQCIFIGTVNPDGVGYLIDSTGNRRFWPVQCQFVDIEGLSRVRDQLFAEAKYHFEKGEKLYIEDVALQKEAEREADARTEQDPWVDMIRDWSEGPGKTCKEINTTKIYETVINGMAKNISRGDQMRIGKALLSIGWLKIRKSNGFVYVRELEEKPYAFV